MMRSGGLRAAVPEASGPVGSSLAEREMQLSHARASMLSAATAAVVLGTAGLAQAQTWTYIRGSTTGTPPNTVTDRTDGVWSAAPVWRDANNNNTAPVSGPDTILSLVETNTTGAGWTIETDVPGISFGRINASIAHNFQFVRTGPLNSIALANTAAPFIVDTTGGANDGGWNPRGLLTSTGTQGIQKLGAGLLHFRFNTFDHTYQGLVDIQAGAVTLERDGSLGNLDNDVRIGNAGLRHESNTVVRLALNAQRGIELTDAASQLRSDQTTALNGVAYSREFVINGNITGTGRLNKAGSGLLSLTGTNTYSGGTTVAGGALTIANVNAVPNHLTGGVTLTAGATPVAGAAFGGRLGPDSSLTAADLDAIASNAAIFDAANKNFAIEVSPGNSATYASSFADLNGARQLVKVGGGHLAYAGTATHTGGTRVQHGVLTISNPASIPNYLTAAGLSINAGAGFGFRVGPDSSLSGGDIEAIIGNDSSAIWAANTFLAVEVTGANSVSLASQVRDPLVGGATVVSRGFVKVGSGTLVLANGSNDYTGATRVNDGTLVLGDANALATSPLDLLAADTGAFSFGSLTSANLAAVRGERGLSLTNANGQAVALTVGGNGAGGTLTGNLTGLGSFTKVGSGGITLGGNNTYAGRTTVSAGGAAFTTRTALYGGDTTKWTPANLGFSTTGRITFGVGGPNQFTAADLNVLLPLGAGSDGFGATTDLGLDTAAVPNNGEFVYNGNITDVNGGVRDLFKTGTGILALGGNNTFSGTLSIGSGGFLKATSSNALGTGTGAITGLGGGTNIGGLMLEGGITLNRPITLPSRTDFGNGITAGAHIINTGGNNTYAGTITTTGGGNGWSIESRAGSLTITSNLTNGAGGFVRPFAFWGTGDGVVTGVISSGTGAGTTQINKYGTGTWTFTGANTYTAGTFISAGTLKVDGTHTGGAAYTIGAAGRLAGSGSITLAGTNAVTNSGAINPGAVGAVGTLTVANPLTMATATASLEIDIASSSSFDKLVVSGAAVAANGTIVPNLLGSFVPATTDTFEVVTMGSVTGSFVTSFGYARTANGKAGLEVDVSSGTSVVLKNYQLVGDVDVSGAVNNQDIAPFVALLTGGSPTGAVGFAADVDGNGVVNNQDIAPFVALLTGGRPLADLAGDPEFAPLIALVPEPGTLGLLAAAGVLGLRRRRSA
jgi:autotransporter-associated beta strand protein